MKHLPRPCLVDTNVAIVANGKSEQADDSLVEKCINAILELTRNIGRESARMHAPSGGLVAPASVDQIALPALWAMVTRSQRGFGDIAFATARLEVEGRAWRLR